jgi:hypothetical protein
MLFYEYVAQMTLETKAAEKYTNAEGRIFFWALLRLHNVNFHEVQHDHCGLITYINTLTSLEEYIKVCNKTTMTMILELYSDYKI